MTGSLNNKILCDIYKGDKKEEMYLYVPKKIGQNGLENIPEALLQSFGGLTLVTTLVLTDTRKLARADIHKVMAELKETGFYLQMPPVKCPLDEQQK
jgi:uncharacterized protein YcgL (UPF0745 family)